MIALLIITFLGITIIEVPGLIKKSYWKELIVFLIILLLAFIPSILLTIEFELPSLIKGIEIIIKYILNIVILG